MKKLTFATLASSALAALAIGLAGPSIADAGSGAVPLLPGGPVSVYPEKSAGSTSPNIPYGVNPYVPFGVWAQH